MNTWEEAELKIFITYALVYMSVQVSCFCLGWKCYVIRRVCLSGRYFLVGSLKHLLPFIFFSYSFPCLVLEEGPDFFHSQCKTVQRTESALCESHTLSLHLEGVLEGSVTGEVLALEGLNLV